MPTAFDVMIQTAFADPNIASSAVYAPFANSSATVAVSVAMVNQDDVQASPFAGKASKSQVAADVAAVQIAQPAEGDRLTVAGKVYTVAAFKRDVDRLVWRLQLRES